VRRRLFAFCASFLYWAAPAQAGDTTAAYAAILRAFAPGLGPATARHWAALTIAEADRAGLDARLIVALIAVESGWNPGARSPAGARGLGQLMPATAAELGVDPDNPAANLHGAVIYLRRLIDRYAGRPATERYALALAAYNAGAAAVSLAGGIPPYDETRRYVARVLALWRQLVEV
jgi:soluble lytic murein transglycosylase-like protein